MTLGEFVKQYKEQHNMSSRSFAAMVGISPQQVLNIEKGIGNDGKPMTSTWKTYQKIADAVGMSENDFLNVLSDGGFVNPEDDEDALLEEVEFLYRSTGALEVIRECMRLSEKQMHELALIAKEMTPKIEKPQKKHHAGLIVSEDS